MSGTVGDKALSGEWERISNKCIEIKEDMKMTFEGQSCNIEDGQGNLVHKLGRDDGLATRDVLAGYLCYVLLARVKFEKKDGPGD